MPRKVPYSPETQFKKGKTGNPNGRPKKLPELEVIIANVLGEEKDGKTAAEAILMALRARAMKGGAEGNRAAELLLNRGYGLPKQPIDLKSDNKITLEIVRRNSTASE